MLQTVQLLITENSVLYSFPLRESFSTRVVSEREETMRAMQG